MRRIFLVTLLVIVISPAPALLSSASTKETAPTWVRQTKTSGTDFRLDVYNLKDIDCSSTISCVATDGYSFIRTADGVSWSLVSVSPTFPPSSLQDVEAQVDRYPSAQFFRDVEFASPTVVFVAASNSDGAGRILKSDDAGATWRTHDKIGVSQLSFPTEQEGYALGGLVDRDFPDVHLRIVRRTSTGGSQWTDLSTIDGVLDADLDCPSPAKCYLVGYSNYKSKPATLVTSVDGGDSWTATNHDPAPGETLPEMGFTSASCPTVSVCTIIGGDRTIYRTSDGETFQLQQLQPERLPNLDPSTQPPPPATAPLHDVSCPTSKECHVASHALYSTMDEGETWTITRPATRERVPGHGGTFKEVWENPNAVSCPAPKVCYAVGDRGLILKFAEGSDQGVSTQSPTANPSQSPTASPTQSSSPEPGEGQRSVTLSASKAKVAHGRQVRLSGRLSSEAASCAGPDKVVEISRRIRGENNYQGIGEVSTDATGAFEFTHTADASSDYIAAAPSDAVCSEATSDPASVAVRVVVKAKASDKTPARGKAFSISGLVKPHHEGTKVVLQRKAGKKWRDVALKTLNPKSRFKFSLKAKWKGTKTFRVVWLKGHKDHAVGKSKPVKVRTT